MNTDGMTICSSYVGSVFIFPYYMYVDSFLLFVYVCVQTPVEQDWHTMHPWC